MSDEGAGGNRPHETPEETVANAIRLIHGRVPISRSGVSPGSNTRIGRCPTKKPPGAGPGGFLNLLFDRFGYQTYSVPKLTPWSTKEFATVGGGGVGLRFTKLLIVWASAKAKLISSIAIA